MSVREKLLNYVKLGDVNLLQTYVQENCKDIDWMNTAHKRTGDSLLNYAARSGNVAIMQYLLGQGMSVHTANYDGKTALHEAAQFGHVEILINLIKRGANVDALRRGDWTPGMLACTKDNLVIVQYLVQNGANTAIQNKDGWTMFHIASREGNIPILRYLLKTNEKCWATRSKNGRTPLHTAACHGKTETVLLFLEKCNFEIDQKDSCGSTPLMDALRGGYLEIADALIKKGADHLALDCMGRGPFHLAAQVGSLPSITYLITKCSVDVNFRSPTSGVSALHLAAKEGQVDAMNLLLDLRADLSCKDNKGRTALHFAAGGQHLNCVRLLLTRGATDQKDEEGRTALSLAVKDPIKELLANYT